MAKRIVGKTVIKGKVSTIDHRVFIVGRAAASEQEIRLDFGRVVKYTVVKLSVKDLPRKDAHGRPIRWINNFGVKGPSGRYARRAGYSVLMPYHTGKKVILHGKSGLWRPARKPVQQGKQLRLHLSSGDPAIGIT